jgi:predicted nucleotidyltransferase
MDAHPILVRVAEAMERHKLEAVLIGNAAAVLQGRDADGLQVDFMDYIHGIRSFQELRSRSAEIQIGGARIIVAALADIIRSKKAAGRSQDLAVLPAFENCLNKPRITRQAKLRNLRKENDLAIRDMIRRRLALPVEQRTNFLRKKIGICSSAL